MGKRKMIKSIMFLRIEVGVEFNRLISTGSYSLLGSYRLIGTAYQGEVVSMKKACLTVTGCRLVPCQSYEFGMGYRHAANSEIKFRKSISRAVDH
jgi:hypothetical protein